MTGNDCIEKSLPTDVLSSFCLRIQCPLTQMGSTNSLNKNTLIIHPKQEIATELSTKSKSYQTLLDTILLVSADPECVAFPTVKEFRDRFLHLFGRFSKTRFSTVYNTILRNKIGKDQDGK